MANDMMKIEKLLILMFVVMLVSCIPTSRKITSTTEYTEVVKPTLTTVIPIKTAQNTYPVTSSPMRHTEAVKPTLATITPIKVEHGTITASPLPTVVGRENRITAMTLDDDGYLWIATSNNVVRWNVETGQYSAYKLDNSIQNGNPEQITSIASISDEIVLALGYSGRVVKLKDGEWTEIIQAHSIIGDLNTQRNGVLWISLGYSGAYQYNGISLMRIKVPEPFDCGFASLLEGNGELWAVDGICMKQPSPLRKYDGAKWTEVKGYYPGKLSADIQGNIWFLDHDAGLVRADLTTKIDFPVNVDFSYPMDFAFAPDGSLWLVDYDDGVYHFSNEQWERVDEGIAINKIMCLVVGQDGSVYVGTDGHGMFRFSKSEWSQYLLGQ